MSFNLSAFFNKVVGTVEALEGKADEIEQAIVSHAASVGAAIESRVGVVKELLADVEKLKNIKLPKL